MVRLGGDETPYLNLRGCSIPTFLLVQGQGLVLGDPVALDFLDLAMERDQGATGEVEMFGATLQKNALALPAGGATVGDARSYLVGDAAVDQVAFEILPGEN